MYLSKGVTITNSEGRGKMVLSEFASSVDVTICNNKFVGTMGLDLGLAFFDVCNNETSGRRKRGRLHAVRRA